MSKSTRRNVVLLKEESVYGNDPTPTPADNAILAMDLEVNVQGDKIERSPGLASLGRFNPIIGKRWIELTFGVEIRGSGTAGVAPRVGDALEACGLAEDAQVSCVDYAPSSENHKSVTIYAYIDGVVWKVVGCFGSVEVVGDINAIGRLNFTFMGLYADYIDVALPSGCVYDPRPEPFLNAAFTYDSITAFKISQIQANLQNEIVPSEDVNHVNGVSGFTISGRNVVGSFNPEMVTKATYDFYGKWKASTAAAMSVTFGQTAGKKMTLSAPAVTMDSVKPGDRGGIRMFDIPVSYGLSTGDDEIKLRFA
jgi:hypothetical protein